MTLLEVMQSRLGIQEVPGAGNNPAIVAMFKAAGHSEVTTDSTAWCSACASSAAVEAGLPMPPVNINLMARSWLTWGVAVDVDDVQPGDVAVWPRGSSTWQGHVNVVESAQGDKVVCIGGNQSGPKGGAVTRAKPRMKSEALGFRSPVASTVPALRAAGSKEIAKADNIQNGGWLVTVIPTMIATAQSFIGPVEVPKFGSLKESLDWWGAIMGAFNAVGRLVTGHPWLAGTLVLGLLCVMVGRKLKADRLAKHSAGMPLSVEVAKLDVAHAAG